MTRPKQIPVRRIKHHLYDLHTADLPEHFFLSPFHASQINTFLSSLGYQYRFFPIELMKGDHDERSS
ncbi:hypothetical protein ES703_44796 [subsurface metagenome]